MGPPGDKEDFASLRWFSLHCHFSLGQTGARRRRLLQVFKRLDRFWRGVGCFSYPRGECSSLLLGGSLYPKPAFWLSSRRQAA